MYRVYFLVFIITLSLLFTQASYAGKKQCQPYLEKLRNIQSQQRHGYGVKKGKSLKNREAKARKKWWQCEQGKLKLAKKSKKKSKQKKLPMNLSSIHKLTKVKSFGVSGPLVVKSRYQGKKLQLWLAYYQQPKNCSRPKTTKQFVFCVEDKQAQEIAFEQIHATDKYQ